MDCAAFENLMDAFEAGTLPIHEREAAERHLSSCPSCRRLHESLRGLMEAFPGACDESLTAEILQRTSGPACNRAEIHLCGLVDGDLENADRQILELHMDHCTSCAAIAGALRELKATLPEMACLEPGGDTTAAILRATAVHSRSGKEAVHWWRRMLQRPRFAWEAAYVGALLILLAIGNPGAWIQRLPEMYQVPRMFVPGGDQLLQETRDWLATTRSGARRSLDAVCNRGDRLMHEAEALSGRAADAVLRQASAFVEDLKANVRDDGHSAEPRRESR